MSYEAAIYARVSTEKQELDNQLYELREYCFKNGWHVFGEYTDIVSGASSSRSGFESLFLHAHQRYFNIVLFWDLSRFSRAGTLYTLQKLKELDNLGIRWVSYKEPYFNSVGEFKDVVISIMSTLAKLERERISDRTKAGLKNAHNVGKRGKDKRPRRTRSDRGLKRGGQKKGAEYLKEIRDKGGRF